MTPRHGCALRQRDVSAERLTGGGWRLSAVVGDRLVTGRYFDYTLREAKARFVADARAGAL